MSRYINDSDDEVFDFLSRQTAKPGEGIDVPDEDDECYEDHPIWKPVVSLGKKPSTPDDEKPDEPDDESQKEE